MGKRGWILYGLAALIFVAASLALWKGITAGQQSAVQPKPADPVPAAQPEVSPNGDGSEKGTDPEDRIEDINLTDYLTDWGIFQKGETGSSAIVRFGNEGLPFPTEPVTYALYLEEAYMFVKFRAEDERFIESLLSEMQFDGKVMTTSKACLSLNRDKCFEISVRPLDDRFTVRWGSLPEVSIERREQPLQYKLAASSAQSVDPLMFRAREHSVQVYVPENEHQVVLAFPDPMRTDGAVIEQSDGTSIGEWIDEQHYRIPLEPGLARLNLHIPNSMYSISGDYLDMWDQSITIMKARAADWIDDQSSQKLPISAYGKYYSFAVPSPNREHWIGYVDLGGPIADESGHYYGIVLDDGRGAEVIADVLHAPDGLRNLPVEWMDEEHIIFQNYGGKLFKYNIHAKKQTEFIGRNGNPVIGVHEFAVDRYARKIYVLSPQPNIEWEEDNPEMGVDLFTYTFDSLEPDIKNNFAVTKLENKYHWMRLTINPTEDGVYWTRTEGDKAVTEFIHRTGKKEMTEGRVLSVAGNHVLVDYPMLNMKGEPGGYSVWTPGAAPQSVDVPEGQYLRLFGPYAWYEQYEGETAKAVYYNVASKRWEEPSLGGIPPHELANQSFGAFYKRPN